MAFALVRCPQCSTPTPRARVAPWVVVLAFVACFPLAVYLMVKVRPASHCSNCGYTWEA